MRKLPRELECPIDNLVYTAVEYLAPKFHKLKITPNQITTISNAFGIAAAYFIFQLHFVLGAGCFAAAYLFDCLDGYVARKYGMVSKIGDIYDHVSDVFKITITLIALFAVNSARFFLFFPIYAILFLLQLVHFGCQERYYGKSESATLGVMTPLCAANKVGKIIKYSRYFGCGTSMAFLVLVILLYGVKTPEKLNTDSSYSKEMQTDSLE